MASNRELEAMFLAQGEQEEGEEELMTAQEVLAEIETAWINEKLSPDLLPHKAELVEVLMEQIDQMEENISRLTSGDLRAILHRCELERLRYILSSYLRCRLEKLHRYPLYCLTEQSPLSPQEKVFVTAFAQATLHHLKTTVDNIPGPSGQLNVADIEMRPDLESHVFVRSKTEGETILIEDNTGQAEEEVTLSQGSQHILPYKSIGSLITQNKVQLI